MKDLSLIQYLLALDCPDSATFRELMGSFTDEHLAKIKSQLEKIIPKRRPPRMPVDLAEYQVSKQKMATILDQTWRVDLQVHESTGIRDVKYIVSMQPDPKAENWWFIRLLDWSVIRMHMDQFTLDGEVLPEVVGLPRLVLKTHMARFFTLQNKLLKTEIKWKKLDRAFAWNQLMLGQLITKKGEAISLTHDAYDALEKAYYWLEDTRTRRTDYQWGKPVNPLADHKRGKKSRKDLIEGEIPIDVGDVIMADRPIYVDPDGYDQPERDREYAYIEYVKTTMAEMVRYHEAELMCVGMPHRFVRNKLGIPSMKRMSTIFQGCQMHPDVYDRWAEVLWDTPYWKVKDENKDRWYVYSYDWRFGKVFSWAVLPIGYLEAANDGRGWYFCMFSADTLAGLRRQSLFIADYRVKITGKLAWRLDLSKECIDDYLEFSVYNDWALKVYREMALPGVERPFTDDELRVAEVHGNVLNLPKVYHEREPKRVVHVNYRTEQMHLCSPVEVKTGVYKASVPVDVVSSVQVLYHLEQWLPKALLQCLHENYANTVDPEWNLRHS